MPSEAQRTVELHRLTGMPVLVCRDAIRFGDGDRKRELEHLESRPRRNRGGQRNRRYVGVSACPKRAELGPVDGRRLPPLSRVD
jgi:hypothetical protein